MSESEPDNENDEVLPIPLADAVLAPSDAVFADVVETLRKLGHVRENEIVTELDLEVRVEQGVEITHFKAENPQTDE